MELILNEHAFAQQAIACGTVGKTGADLGLHFPLPLL